MNKKLIPLDEIKQNDVNTFPGFVQGPELEQRLLELIGQARADGERYFLYLHYAEILLKAGRWEESNEVLIQSALIAVKHKNMAWLIFSHERLGDLSAAEESWFSALHHYSYALREAVTLSDHPALDRLGSKVNVARGMLHSTALSQDKTIIALSREYVSGNMAISFVHRDIFLKKYFARCLECNFCHDWCCSFGADIDIENVEKIKNSRAEILPFIRQSDEEWFDAEYSYYEGYAGNQYTRINPLGPRCTFISRDQRGCGLHRYAISKQMDYHEIKPLVCILFPLGFSDGVLSLAPELDDDSLVCSGSGASTYRSLRSELEHYFGRGFVEDLDGVEKAVLGQS